MRTWIKLYTEILRDPKMFRLTDRQFRVCVNLFALGGVIDEDGWLGSLSDLSFHLRVDPDELLEDMETMSGMNIVERQADGDWCLVHFEARQSRPPSAEAHAVTERVQRHRDKMKRDCNEDVTRAQRRVTPSDSDQIRSDTDTDQQQTADSEGASAPSLPAAAVPADGDVNPASYGLLIQAGVGDPSASRLAAKCEPAIIEAFLVAMPQQRGLTNPAGWLVKQLDSGKPPPRAGPSRREQYAGGAYADCVET